MLPSNTKTPESDILRMLDELEAMVDSSPQVLHHAFWVQLDRFFTLTSHMRQHLPDDIRRATKVARDSEKIVEQARVEAERLRSEGADDAERMLEDARRTADRLVRDAEEHALRLIAEHEIVRQAQHEGQKIVDEAADEARRVRDGADEYAAGVLMELDETLSRTVGYVRRGLEKLGRRGE